MVVLNFVRAFCIVVLIAMLWVTSWASLKIPLWEAGPHVSDPWSVATLFDAYFGFLTFYLWVLYKERTPPSRTIWLVLVLTLGNIAMAIYLFRETFRAGKNASVKDLLTVQHG